MSCFKKVAIIGPGLLGGSIALAMKAKMANTKLSLWGRREEVAAQARAAGISEATSDLAEALNGADLVILAVPVGVMPKLAEQMDLSQDLLVTDVGSVKRVVHHSANVLETARDDHSADDR